MIRFLLTPFLLFISAHFAAQSTQDMQSIRSMCGCYEVTFAFAETFSPDTSYEFHENYNAKALEWVEMVRDNGDLMQLQHILVVGGDQTVKHWRQDWMYQPQESMTYNRGRHWTFTKTQPMDVAGRWSQSVFQVDDSPRYSAIGTWIHADGKHYWEAETRTPLPRREYTKRSDYDVMDRLNRHEVHATGWIHEQDNKKILFNDDNEVVIAEEKGRNTYIRVADERCQAARDYWNEHHSFWNAVRTEWNAHLNADNGQIELKSKVEGKPLYVHLMTHPLNEVSTIVKSFIK
jgi:hypothetical protein